VFQTWKVRGELMKPTLRDGDIVIVLPCLSFSDKMLISLAGIPQKGDVVLVEDGSESIVPTMTMIEDSALRFMTLQKYSLLAAEFGKGFGLPTVMRIQSIQHDKDISKSQPVYRLATDCQSDKNFMTGDRIVPPSLIKGRVVLKIWPLARIGKVQ